MHPSHRSRSLRRFGGLCALALVLGACDSGTGRSSSPPPRTATSATTSALPPPLDPAGGGYSSTEPLALESQTTTTSGNAEITHVTFASARGVRVPALLMQPRLARNPHPCVVVAHGLGGSKEDARPIFDALALAGMGGIAIDDRLHGERGDAAARRAAVDDPRELARAMQGTIVDLRRAVDVLAQASQCDRSRLSYLGLSFGGFLGALVAALDDRIEAPALLSAGGAWVEVLRTTSESIGARYRNASPAFLARAHRELDPFDPDRWVFKIAPRPVFLVNGEQDTVVVPAASRPLHAAAFEPKKSYWYDGGHVPEGSNAVRVIAELTAWFVGHLR